MNNKIILISGTDFLQESLLRKAKNKNFYIIGINEKHVNIDLCNEFYQMDCRDENLIFEMFKDRKLDGVITTVEDKRMLTLSKLANYKGLPFPDRKSIYISIRKDLMKTTFLNSNINCAKSYGTFYEDEYTQIYKINFDYSIVIKPVDSSGSKGVIKIHDNMMLHDRLKETFAASKEKKIMIEEYVGGKEYSCESLIQNGKINIIQITEKITTNNEYFVEMGHIQPAILNSGSINNMVFPVVENVIKSIGLDNCGCHTEFKVFNDKIYIIENAPRLAGDCISSSLTTISTGIDLEEQLLNISIGKPADIIKLKRLKYSGIKFFHFGVGKKLISINKLDDLLSDSIVDLKLYYSLGDTILQNTSSKTRLGYIIGQSNNRDQLLEQLDNTTIEIQKRLCFK